MYAAQTQATTPKLQITLRQAYGLGSRVMGMIPFDGQAGVFAFPGATMGAMGAAAMSRARQSGQDEAAMLRSMEVEASFHSATSFGSDELIDPGDTEHPPHLAGARPAPPPKASRTSRPFMGSRLVTRVPG